MQKKLPIAVVGMAGIFPGAPDIDIFWNNIINKVDSSSEVPDGRWIVEPEFMYNPEPAPDKAFSKRACLIHDDILKSIKSDLNDINIDKDILDNLDPLFHLVLHAGKKALSNCNISTINKERIGTVLAAIALPTDSSSSITREIIGKSFEEKLFKNSNFSTNKPLSRAQCLASRVTSLPASILAKGLGLGGGSYTLDAACASSLYAVKLACDELHSLRADVMLAGGVSRPECLYTQVGFSQLRALSPSGRCAPFDEKADGLVVGEGAGILVLKRLDDALRDKDCIYGLIRGIGLSNDMSGNLLAPDIEGQVRAMRNAYLSVGWSPCEIDLIECHGAGTRVGDTTELHSLRKLWGESGWSYEQCSIGSVKSMIGHLLTAAGAAGMIKTFLALKHKVLPPSINFNKAPEKSPLKNSPFRVQTKAEEWIRKNNERPFRAAVSAFGFGGINGHLLIEEWCSDSETRNPQPVTRNSQLATRNSQPPIAIVGMDAAFGRLNSLKDFKETIFKGSSIIRERPEDRWKGCDNIAAGHLDGKLLYGAFMDKLALTAGEFHMPPNEIPDILVQHLLMLKVSSNAMKDAGLVDREKRPKTGVVIGMEFDFEATNYHLRWNLYNLVQKWINTQKLNLNEKETKIWLESLKNSSGPALTNSRTIGALGGIIASRIAREFRFGGPSFAVSCEGASGLKALEIGVRSLQQDETDAVLVGAIDLSGDVRNVITTNKLKPYSKNNEIHPFDRSADGTLPGEGAAALVLKRLDSAIKDGDRIYSIIKGLGCATGDGIDTETPSKSAYTLSLKRSFQDADISSSSISYFETHGSGDPFEDNLESEALNDFFAGLSDNKNVSCAIGSVKANIGHTGAASGLASLVKTSLCLYHEIIPPLTNFIMPANDRWQDSVFHMPAFPQYWLRDRKDGPRRACTASLTSDGNCMHVILEGFEYSQKNHMLEKVEIERRQPLGDREFGLFVIEGNNKTSLMEGLEKLSNHIEKLKQPNALSSNIEAAARSWYLKNKLKDERPTSNVQHRTSNNDVASLFDNFLYKNNPVPEKKYAVSIVAADISQLEKLINDAKNAVSEGTSKRINGLSGISYSPDPLGLSGKTAFVFPGSGNHYVGMGRGIGVQWPEILRKMDAETQQLRTQLVPQCYVPQRTSWMPGWEKEAYKKIISDPLNMIFGQVVHGGVTANLIMNFGIKPSAVIGYSLGESAGLFALGAWSDRGEMLKRMRETDLFSTELAGPCNSARRAWNIPPDKDIKWCVAVVNRPANDVKSIINKFPYARLLIINTPDECVIGGQKDNVEASIKMLGCEAIFLDGIVSVHCDAAVPVADAYKKLHVFPTASPENIKFYSCALGRSYALTSDSAASSILKQAIEGFDFTALIDRAYEDGIRIFLEMGPHSSCTRMISRILDKKPHMAVSACVRGENNYITVLKFLGSLITERVPVDLDKIYGTGLFEKTFKETYNKKSEKQLTLTIGGRAPSPALPRRINIRHAQTQFKDQEIQLEDQEIQLENLDKVFSYNDLIGPVTENVTAVSEAHKTFINFSNDLTKGIEKTFATQTRILEKIISGKEIKGTQREIKMSDVFAFSRDMCMEFAIGSAAKVLGPEFAAVDSYKVRVRLPDEPLMLVDRIISVEGEKGSLGPGRIVTEHDVLPGAWYLDGGHAPVCISVEAGQADLFLCSYLGIDLAVKGERGYRLLDAVVKFHRGLPCPGDVIRYEIEIEKFVRQGDTFLFFFSFEGFINNKPLISMTDGCAGFFTEEEVKKSGGIILTKEDTEPVPGKKPSGWNELVQVDVEKYNNDKVEALRAGNLEKCFGALFNGIKLADSLKLPGGRMKLIDRILNLDPKGGRYGMGMIRAEADIHPDDWFLTCHFKDDMVMPGTLMYECCAHTLRVFIQRMGWVTDKPGVCYEPVIGVESILKCRGPVTSDTRHVVYEVEIKETGYGPEPFVIADAHMFGDGRRIVMFKDMSMKMSGITREEIESAWKKKTGFDYDSILAFSTGKPSEAFGEPYKVFDEERIIARLPGPPYLFIDRITNIEPEQWVLKPGGWIEAEYEVPPDEWYFKANRIPAMPYCILLEIALQPCGWLAAYMGSALKSKKNLKFRNLGGKAVLHHQVLPDSKILTMRTRMTKVAEAGDMIIEHFDIQILQSDKLIYEGITNFGFFTKKALAQQVGIIDAAGKAYKPDADELKRAVSHVFDNIPPFTPYDLETAPAPCPAMPSKALLMVDEIETYIRDGGTEGLGFIRGVKKVDPNEWFFKAHFYQDPVCPGSLGIESFIQLIKFMAIDRWSHLIETHTFEFITDKPHIWIYRGQIVPENKKIEIEAVVTKIQDIPVPTIQANGFLKVDGLYIYEMQDFGIRFVPIN